MVPLAPCVTPTGVSLSIFPKSFPNCDFRTHWGDIDCYDSCGGCNPSNGCQWTTCYDDVAYTEAVVDEVLSNMFAPEILIWDVLQVSRLFCVDLRSIHQSGISNGGMFSYFSASRSFSVWQKIVTTTPYFCPGATVLQQSGLWQHRLSLALARHQLEISASLTFMEQMIWSVGNYNRALTWFHILYGLFWP